MLALNITAMTELTQAFAKDMAARGRGRILLTASLTGHQPMPGYAAYGASKAYVRSFGEALHVELAAAGVTVTVLSPGLMETGFLDATGQQPSAAMRRSMTPPRNVARTGIDALLACKPSAIAGTSNKILAVSNRFTSRHWQAKIAYHMMSS